MMLLLGPALRKLILSKQKKSIQGTFKCRVPLVFLRYNLNCKSLIDPQCQLCKVRSVYHYYKYIEIVLGFSGKAVRIYKRGLIVGIGSYDHGG
jgi:hypothetical protein